MLRLPLLVPLTVAAILLCLGVRATDVIRVCLLYKGDVVTTRWPQARWHHNEINEKQGPRVSDPGGCCSAELAGQPTVASHEGGVGAALALVRPEAAEGVSIGAARSLGGVETGLDVGGHGAGIVVVGSTVGSDGGLAAAGVLEGAVGGPAGGGAVNFHEEGVALALALGGPEAAVVVLVLPGSAG